MEAPEAAGPLAGVGMRGWRMTPRAAPLGDEPVAQMENKVSAKRTEQALSTPFHLWGHVPCPQARMAIGQTEPLAPTATRSGQEVQAGGKLTGMSVLQLRRSAGAGDKGQTDHLSSSASSSSSMSGHHWQHGTQGDTGKTPSKRNHSPPRVTVVPTPLPMLALWQGTLAHCPLGAPVCWSPVPDHTPPHAHCEAQPTAKPLEAFLLPPVINLSLCRGSRAAKMLLSALGASLGIHWVMPNRCHWGIPLAWPCLLVYNSNKGPSDWLGGSGIVSVPLPAPWLGKTPAPAPAPTWLRDTQWATAPRQDSCCRQTDSRMGS